MKGWALVTGSSQRIGRAIALELAANGWNIVVHYNKSRDAAEETAAKVKEMGREAHVAKANFSNKRQTENFIPSLVKEIGPLAALVNNASFFEPDSRAPGGCDHKAVNLEAPLLLGEAFRKQMPRGKSGVIVNILDNCVPEAGFTSYADSKKSLRVMTIETARRMAPDVRVNGVALGPVLRAPRQSEAHFKRLVDSTLLKTEITPQSVAATVRFLAETPSIAGEILHVDGGIRLRNTPPMLKAAATG